MTKFVGNEVLTREMFVIGLKMGLKFAIDLTVYETICWDGQFYLRESKIRDSLGVSAEFAFEKWSTPKTWNIAISWITIAFRSWNFAEIYFFPP